MSEEHMLACSGRVNCIALIGTFVLIIFKKTWLRGGPWPPRPPSSPESSTDMNNFGLK